MTDWTDDRVETLKRLWTDGLSAAEVARHLGGVTRNAVIGKIHRLGLSGRATPSTPRQARPARPARPPRLPKPPRALILATPTAPRPPPPPPEGPGSIVQLEDLRGCHCRWPIGDPRANGFTWCGRKPVRGPYCAGHAAVAYQPRQPRKRRRRALAA